MKIGIIGAMDVEVARLTAGMNKEREIERAGMHFCEGWIGGSEVVVVRCGIGKVNAGLCVQILCDLFDVTHVINTGIAGSLDEEINIGDVVVSIDAMYHDMDVTGLGYEPGQVPQLKVLAFPADNMLRVAWRIVHGDGRCGDRAGSLHQRHPLCDRARDFRQGG